MITHLQSGLFCKNTWHIHRSNSLYFVYFHPQGHALLATGAKRGHPRPAHSMDSPGSCVHLVNTVPQVATLFIHLGTDGWFQMSKKTKHYFCVLFFLARVCLELCTLNTGSTGVQWESDTILHKCSERHSTKFKLNSWNKDLADAKCDFRNVLPPEWTVSEVAADATAPLRTSIPASPINWRGQ